MANLTGYLQDKDGNRLFLGDKGVTLYENTNGATSNITLTESVENYKKLLIEFRMDTNYTLYGVEEVIAPNGKYVVLSRKYYLTASNGNDYEQMISSVIYINGNTISYIQNRLTNINWTNKTLTGSSTGINETCKITRVIGFTEIIDDTIIENNNSGAIQQALEWKYVGETTGTTFLDLPENYNELYILVKGPQQVDVEASAIIPKTGVWETDFMSYKIGGGYSTNSGSTYYGSIAVLYMNQKQVRLNNVYVNGQGITSTSHMFVYYR